MDVYSLYFIIKVKLPARTWHQQEKKMNIKFVMYRFKIYLSGSSLFSFYQGMVRTMKMSFYKRKNIEIGATLPTPQRAPGSVTKTCGLLST